MMNALQEVITSIHSYAFSEMTLLEQVELLDKAQLEYDTLRAELEQVKAEREELAELWRDYAEFLVDNEVAMAFCPVCKGEQSRGHESDCELAAVLGKDGGA